MSRIAKLPAGYRQVEYIQSSGEQYVDTGVKPNQNARVVIDLQLMDNTGVPFIFGTWPGSIKNSFSAYWWTGGTNSWGVDYGTQRPNLSFTSWDKRLTIDFNKNVFAVNESSHTLSAETFQAANNLALLALNENGTAKYFAKAKVYSCRIYDNGTLVRDYIPCINPTGEAGLYDLVYGVFYGNAGTGVFAVGRNVYSEDEITKLEYVESSGAQYIDTGFVPNQDTRVVAKLLITPGSTTLFAFGARTSSSSNAYCLVCSANGYYSSSYGTYTTGLSPDFNRTVPFVIDKNKNVTYIDGVVASTATEATFTAPNSMYLFAVNEKGTAKKSASRFYSCEIYDDGTLNRDYLPATVNGEVGLWDACSGVLYTSESGTALIAGPEMENVPSTPSNLEILEYTDTNVLLGWSAVANAFGYRVYKNGSLYADQTATEFSDDVTPYQNIEYGVSAYNDKGESKTALLTVYISPDNPIPYLITDRTQADADRVATLASMGYESMTDTERAEWDSGLKGAYNASDLNRVESAVAYLAEALRVLPVELQEYAKNLDVGWDEYFDVPYDPNGYEVSTKENWTLKDVPTPADMERYLANVVKLRNALKFASDALPQTMNDLRWQGANAIESALKNLDTAIALFKENTQIMIVNTAAAWAFSGEVFMGEV